MTKKNLNEFFLDLCQTDIFSVSVNEHQTDFLDIKHSRHQDVYDTISLNDFLDVGTIWRAENTIPKDLQAETQHFFKKSPYDYEFDDDDKDDGYIEEHTQNVVALQITDFFNLDVLDPENRSELVFFNQMAQHIFRERFTIETDNEPVRKVSMADFFFVSGKDFDRNEEGIFKLQSYDMGGEKPTAQDIEKSGIVFVSHLYNSMNSYYPRASTSFSGMTRDLIEYGLKQELLDPHILHECDTGKQNFLLDVVQGFSWENHASAYRASWNVLARRLLRDQLPDKEKTPENGGRLI